MPFKKSLYPSLFLALFFIKSFSFAQPHYPQNYFRSPLDIPLYLSGNFAELRSNHFHAGIDLKTEGVTGKYVYAAADGYISRIKVSPFGYGKAIYIKHANGYTSVYAHLKEFSKEVDKLVKGQQYKQKKFSVNIYPPSSSLRIKKGDIIALSGNSGGSGGPHLHFEIRDSKTEHPLNPLLFGFKIKDTIKPKIYNLAVYPQDQNSFIDNKNSNALFTVKGQNGRYHCPDNPIEVHGNIGFGVFTYDFLNGSSNKCGVYSIELYIDSTLRYSYKLNKFSFSESRYINSHMDYEANVKRKRKIHKTFVEPNNKLSIYNNIVNRGIFNFNDDKIHHVSFILKDAYQNMSTLNFKVQSSKTVSDTLFINCKSNHKCIMPYQKKNFFNQGDIILSIPENSLYDTLYFTYEKSEHNCAVYSPIHHVHNKYTPVHKSYKLSIKPENLPDELYSKALIASIDEKNELSYVGGNYSDGYISTKTKTFGDFVIAIDTIVPKIKPINIYNNKDLSQSKKIDIKITDELSGIDLYNGFIDDKWALFEYDGKNDKLTYFFDDTRITKGKSHTLRLIVIDKKGNKSEYYTNFIY